MGGTQADDDEDADAVHGGFMAVSCRVGCFNMLVLLTPAYAMLR
jgi:hypothetical protein